MLAEDPNNAQALANLGVLEHQCGKVDEALGYIDRGMAIARDLDEYCDKAVYYSQHPEVLAEIKARLAQNIKDRTTV